MIRHAIIILLLLLTTNTALSGEAGSDSNNARITLKQAIIKVLEFNPALKAAGFESQAATARIQSSLLSTAYSGTIELENFAGSGNYSGSDAMETTLSLSRVLETGNKAELRGELARNEKLLLQNEQDAKRLDLLAETTKRFIDIVSYQRRLENDNESITIATRTSQAVEKRVRAGRSPEAELRRAEITLSRTQLNAEQTKHQLDSARLKLATLWGETDIAYGKADADLYRIVPLRPFSELVTLIENNPDLVRFATEQRLSRSRTLLANSGASSDITITGGVRHFNQDGDTALVMSLDIPFATSSRASSKITEAETMAMRDPYLYEEQRLKLHSTLYELYHQVEQSMDTVTTLRSRIIPQAEDALLDYEKAYAAGRYSFLELTEAQQMLIDLKMEAITAAANYHRYLVEIDRLTGASLTAGADL